MTRRICIGLVVSALLCGLSGGAAIGGFADLAASSGDTQENLETAAAGAALGALIAHLATKHKAQSYLIRRLDGSAIKVIIDHADAMAGDCVAIEEEIDRAADKVKILCQ